MKPIDHSNLINLILITLAYFSFQTFVSANATDQSEPPILQAGLLQSSNDEPLLASSAAPVALSTTPDSFIRYFRYPIEPPAGYVTMDETDPAPMPTAYYRDVYAGAETFLSISGPVASETWRVNWLLPNNQVKQTTIRYFSS